MKILALPALPHILFASLWFCLHSPGFSKEINLVLDWTPNTNHVGIYVAKAKGWLEEEGITLNIMGPKQTTATQLVGAKGADIGISFLADVLLARHAQIPIKSIAAISQNNKSCFAWRKSSSIKSLKDLENKTYGSYGSPVEKAALKYALRKKNINSDKIRFVHLGTNDFLIATEKHIDFLWIFLGWDGVRAKLLNIPIETFCPDEEDEIFNHPSPLLIANENFITNNFVTIKKLISAFEKGYTFAARYPEDASRIMVKTLPMLDHKLVHESLSFLKNSFLDAKNHWGFHTEKTMLRYQEWMNKEGLLGPNYISNTKFFTNEFVKVKK